MPWPQYPKTPEEAEARWDAIQAAGKVDLTLTYPDKKPEVKTEKKAPNPADFGAVPISTKKLSPEDFGAVPVSQERPMSDLLKIIVTPLPINLAFKAQETLDKAAYSTGGAVTDVAAKVVSPEAAAATGTAANMAVQTLPAMIGGSAAGRLVSSYLKDEAKNWMQSAIKPSWEAISKGDAAKAIDTMLEQGINATKGGMQAVRKRVDELNSQVQRVIAESKELVDKKGVAKAIGETLEKFKYQATPKADRKVIMNTWNEFKKEWFGDSETIPVQVAQKIKQGTTRKIDKAYGEMSDADREAQKAVARGMRESVSKAVPEVVPLNAEESKLLNVLDVAEKHALMEANKNIGGLAWIAHNPAGWAAFMADRSAAFKSIAARVAHRQAEESLKTVGKIVGATEGAAVGALEQE